MLEANAEIKGEREELERESRQRREELEQRAVTPLRVISVGVGGLDLGMRKVIGRELKMRNTPELRFLYDDTLDRSIALETTLKQIHDEDEEARGQAVRDIDDKKNDETNDMPGEQDVDAKDAESDTGGQA